MILRLIAASLLLTGFASAQTKNEIAEARQWAASKFLGTADNRPAKAYLAVQLKSGSLQRNRKRDRVFQIAGQTYDGGIAMPSPGEVIVHPPGPCRRFEAVVGVDSNDLGYYSNAGRGSVVATVEAKGREIFRSPVLREGMAGIPIEADLAGAREFTLRLSAVGERGPTYQAEWDQADFAKARVTLEDGGTVLLADVPLGPPSSAYSIDPPFSFRYGGQDSAGLLKTWRLERASRSLDAHRTEHVSTWSDPQTNLQVRCVAVVYDDSPAVEWTVYLKNASSSQSPMIEDLQALDSRFSRTPEGEFLLHHSKGSPNSSTDFEPLETALPRSSEKRIGTRGGRPTDTDLCYFNVEWKDRGVIIGLGWPGQWAALFKRDEDRGLRVAAGQELTHFRLLPGEEVRTPLVALLFWEGDWIRGQNLWRRWMVAHNMPRPGGKLPPPQLAGGSNRHTIEMQEANEDNQKSFLARTLAAGIPIDYWWMDAGWYTYKEGWWKTGTWEPDPRRFPHGFGPVSSAAHAKGVKTVVWFEPERVAPGSWLWEKHPEWLVGPEGKDKLLFLGNPEARQWLVEHISKMIAEQGIDLYRQDFNFEPLLLWRSHDAEDRQGITEIQHVTGYLAYWDELRRRFPNLLIDTCASGGRRDDLETLRRSVPLWRSDFAYEPAAMQQMTYGMSLWMPFFGTAINSVEPYFFRSQMTPALGLGLDPERIEAGYARLQSLIREWRGVADFYYGDYYPLTACRTESTAWLAWQFDRPDRRAGMVQAFRRPDSPFEKALFPLRGLDPSARYLVKDLDSAAEIEFGGKELMGPGLPVTIAQKPGAVVLTYRQK